MSNKQFLKVWDLKVVRRGLTRQLRVVSKFHPQVNFPNQEGMESIPGMYANCLE